MTDHANELRRYSRKIGHPAGDVPSVMLAAADEIERLAARLEAAEKERDSTMRLADSLALALNTSNHERDNLRAKIERMEKRLRLILEEPENTMSNSKAMREMLRQARLALEKSK